MARRHLSTHPARRADPAVRLIVVDDERLIRAGLRAVLEGAGDLTVIAEAADGSEALALINTLVPDVVVLDLCMPVMDGMQVLRRLRDARPRPRVLVLSAPGDYETLMRCWEAGADGFMDKAAGAGELVNAVRCLARGGNMVSSGLVTTVLDRLLKIDGAGGLGRGVAALSPQELRTLHGVAEGKSDREIAQDLDIREATVTAYVSRVVRKLGLPSRAHMALLAGRLPPLVHDAVHGPAERGPAWPATYGVVPGG